MLLSPWQSLILAGIFEIIWAIAMKYSQGFSRFWPTLITLIGLVLSFGFLAYALKQLPLGTAYAVWVGIGTLGVAVFGLFWLEESANWLRLMFIALIVVGVIGLKLTSSQS